MSDHALLFTYTSLSDISRMTSVLVMPPLASEGRRTFDIWVRVSGGSSPDIGWKLFKSSDDVSSNVVTTESPWGDSSFVISSNPTPNLNEIDLAGKLVDVWMQVSDATPKSSWAGHSAAVLHLAAGEVEKTRTLMRLTDSVNRAVDRAVGSIFSMDSVAVGRSLTLAPPGVVTRIRGEQFTLRAVYGLSLLASSIVSTESYDILHSICQKPEEVNYMVTNKTDAPEPVVEKEVQYPRPNGSIYYAREWEGYQDVQVLRKARENNLLPLLYGPPGTGKTALAEAAFGEELVTVVLTGDSEVADLVGSFIPNPDYGVPGEPEYVWVDGPLIDAVENGRPFLADEIGLADAKILSVLYPLMDGRGEVQVTANPARGTVKAADGFFIIGATNPNAPGVRMSEALLSRFTLHAEVTTDWALARKLGVDSYLVTASENLNGRMVRGSLTWAPQFRELMAFRETEKLFGTEFALKNLIASCPEIDRPAVAESLRTIFGMPGLKAAKI